MARNWHQDIAKAQIIERPTEPDINVYKEEVLRSVCREELVKSAVKLNYGHKRFSTFISHREPYIKLGPFKVEAISTQPLRVLVHDFFTMDEMSWIQKASSLKIFSPKNVEEMSLRPDQLTEKETPILSAIQSFSLRFNSVTYNEAVKYTLNPQANISTPYVPSAIKGPYSYSIDSPAPYVTSLLNDPYSYSIDSQIMLRISRKIERFTRMNITSRYGSDPYQSSFYGIGGKYLGHKMLLILFTILCIYIYGIYI